MPTSSLGIKVPQLRRHKHSGKAVVTLNFPKSAEHPNGRRQDVFLGDWGREGPSDDARAEYDRIIGRWLQQRRTPPLRRRLPLI